MLTIGLTGGIGSGKSTVSRILADLGAVILDADKIAQSTYAPGGPAYEAVVAAFGKTIVAADGTIDRARLGPIVFADPAALAKLTSIVWPATLAKMREMIAEMRRKGERNPIIVEAAILIEANWQPLFDEIWLVIASQPQAIERVESQRGMKPAQIEARIKAQLPDSERRKHASMIVDNSGTIAQLEQQMARVWADALKRNG